MTEPSVIDVKESGGQVLASVQRGDLSVVVAAPVDVDQDALEDALADVPETITTYSHLRHVAPGKTRQVATDGGDREE